MIEGFGFGSVPLTNGSGAGSRKPKTAGSRSGWVTLIFTLLNLDIFLWQEEEEEELVGMEGFQCREEARLNILNAAIRHLVSNS
jgi:hypothetical protein